MRCPICDNTPSNCDCSSDAIRLHEENVRLREELQACENKATDAGNERNIALLKIEEMRKALEDIVRVGELSAEEKLPGAKPSGYGDNMRVYDCMWLAKNAMTEKRLDVIAMPCGCDSSGLKCESHQTKNNPWTPNK